MNTTGVLSSADRRQALAERHEAPDSLPMDPELLQLLELPDGLPEVLTIAEAAAATGLTAHTLRYYERVGLIVAGRDEAGHRQYDQEALARVVFITRLRLSDMSISTISHYMDLVLQGEQTAPERLALMQEHRATIQRRLRELQAALAVTDYKIITYGGDCTP
ncbi:MerR family transcriptional regulator [Streptomyces sp. SID13031]|uniref:MerR family transcriptional regulator n=1 Tax=Streptomyces sp. SID13031 TaxID=2706046 RepID=UPI0013C739CB|nr:MerR family transcriptional regulator [Streptomyces sp. SID13031]NEA37156.1 MerR family transcriptional regulator [Streptomyces sp. SID13031]